MRSIFFSLLVLVFFSTDANALSVCSYRYVYEPNNCSRLGGHLPEDFHLSRSECTTLTMPTQTKKSRMEFMCNRLFNSNSTDSRKHVDCIGVPGLKVKATSIEGDFSVSYEMDYDLNCFYINRAPKNCKSIQSYSKPTNYNDGIPCNPEYKKHKPKKTQGWIQTY